MNRNGILMLTLLLSSLVTQRSYGGPPQGEEHYCVFNVKCWTAGNPNDIKMDENIEGPAHEDRAIAKGLALQMAQQRLLECDNEFCEGIEKFIDCYPVADVVPPDPTQAAAGVTVAKRWQCISKCVTGSGSEISVSRTDKKKEVAESAAWAQLVKNAALQGGVVAGTVRTDIHPAHFYMCSQLVKCTGSSIVRSFQVSARGVDETTAKKALKLAVKRVVQDCEYKGENATIDPDTDCDRVHVATPEAFLARCFYKCETAKKINVIVSRIGFGTAAACASAADAAHTMAQQHGGSTKCAVIEPHEQNLPLP